MQLVHNARLKPRSCNRCERLSGTATCVHGCEWVVGVSCVPTRNAQTLWNTPDHSHPSTLLIPGVFLESRRGPRVLMIKIDG